MIAAIHQPNYIPWIGYFAKIAKAEVFVFFDNVQISLNKGYVARNEIKTSAGRSWLTVPTRRASESLEISKTPIVDGNWHRKHLRTIEVAYAGSSWLQPLLQILSQEFQAQHPTIADMNIALIERLAAYMELPPTRFLRASGMSLGESGRSTIPEILTKIGATTYVTGSGTGTQRSIDSEDLRSRGILIEYLPSSYPQYQQRHGQFMENLSILDVLLNCGPEKTRELMSSK